MTGIETIATASPITQTQRVQNAKTVEKSLLNQKSYDTVDFSTNAKAEISKEQKQEIAQKAQTTAAGWSILGGPISTAYFGLRSDKTVAKKYDLDVDRDKQFIKDIKKKQKMWTLPSLIPGFGSIPGVIAWMYNKNTDPSKIAV